MKYVAAFVLMFFSFAVNANNYLALNDDVCALVYQTSIVVGNQIEEKNANSDQASIAVQNAYWTLWNKAKDMPKTMEYEITANLTALWYIKDKIVNFHVDITRYREQFGPNGFNGMTATDRAAERLFSACRMSKSFDPKPFTVPNPADKK